MNKKLLLAILVILLLCALLAFLGLRQQALPTGGDGQGTQQEQSAQEVPAPITANEEDLLIFCRTPRTRAEIEQHFKGRLSINYLMAHIIRPLVGQGKIRLAIPDKPRSKNQKYYS